MTSSSVKLSIVSDALAGAIPIGERDVHLWFAPRQDSPESEAFCRAILSRYATVASDDWIFEKIGQGKPRLINSPVPLEFNLSHSVDWLVCAVTAGVPVGVDIEHLVRQRDVMRLGRRFFAESEVDFLEQLPAAQQRDSFFDLWTLKESAVKARAEALPPALKKIVFSLTGHAAAGIDISTSFTQESAGESYLLLDPIADYRVAICWLGPVGDAPVLRQFHWRDTGEVEAVKPQLRGATNV